MVAVAVGTMALVVVLSVFNGLEDFIRSLYNSFDPELKIMATTGKFFEINEKLISDVVNVNGVTYATEVIEDYAYVKYRDAEMFVKIKGVGENFLKENRLQNSIVEGELKLKEGDFDYAVIGRGVQYTLNISSLKDIYPLQFYYPKKNIRGRLDPTGSLNRIS